MKAGELFNIAQQVFPGITKTMFTHFYNMAVEDMSRIYRINVVEETFEDDEYKTLPTKLVRLEGYKYPKRVSFNVSNNELILYVNGEQVSSIDEITLVYWGLLNNVLALEADDWDEQDDEIDTDAQLYATYYALESLAAIMPILNENIESIRQEMKKRTKIMNIKYNSSRVYKNIRQVSF